MRELPVVTKNLLAINALMFLALLAFEKMGIDLNSILGLHLFIAPDFRLYQLVTYIFMHGSFSHILLNMFSLWMFGRILEQVWGPKRFLTYYMLTGIGAGLLQQAVQYAYYYSELAAYTSVNLGGGMIVPMAEYLNMWTTVGASGAVYGMLLAFALTFPNERLFMFPIPVPIKAKYFALTIAGLELLTGIGNHAGDNVAHFAHLGGMLFGLLLIYYWRKTGKINGPYNF
jgi:membrane associated rhomboid family serine protease